MVMLYQLENGIYFSPCGVLCENGIYNSVLSELGSAAYISWLSLLIPLLMLVINHVVA